MVKQYQKKEYSAASSSKYIKANFGEILENQNVQNFFISILAAVTLAIDSAQAWDHPGHMTTAVIAFEEMKRERPELIETIEMLEFEWTGSQQNTDSGCLFLRMSQTG